jgi:hypothetical protein
VSATQAAGELSELRFGQDNARQGKNVAFGQSIGYPDENLIIASDVHYHRYVGPANDSHGAPYARWTQPA